MRECQFNFNNDVDTFTIHVEDDGRVIVPGENGPLAEYESIEQLAEMYAQSRDVKPENLKNWVLLENGDVYSFVLRAGTAGIDVSECEEQLEQVFQSLEGNHHALSIARAKEQIMADGTADLTEALVHCSETEVARDVYDAMQRIFEGSETEAEPEEEDNRSDLEKYLDEQEEIPGSLSLIAFVAGLPVNVDKAALLESLENNRVLSNVGTLRAIYDNTVSEAIENGIGVESAADAITVITQTPVGEKDEDVKARMMQATRMAGRDKVNISVDIVGTTHIRHTAEIVSLEELDNVELLVRDNVPYMVRFNDEIDAELEAERAEAVTEAGQDDESWDDGDTIGGEEDYGYED